MGKTWPFLVALAFALARECDAATARFRFGAGPSLSGESDVVVGYGLGLGVSSPLAHRMAIRFDAAYDRVPFGGFHSETPEGRIRHDDDQAATVLAGLEVTSHEERTTAPLFFAMAGAARVHEGDLHIDDMNSGSWTETGEKKTVGAVALGGGLRFPIAGRTALRVQFQWLRFISLETLTLVVPFRAELEF